MSKSILDNIKVKIEILFEDYKNGKITINELEKKTKKFDKKLYLVNLKIIDILTLDYEKIRLRLQKILEIYKLGKTDPDLLEDEGEDLEKIIILKYPYELRNNNEDLLSVYKQIAGIIADCFVDPFMPEDVDATLEFLNTNEANIPKAREKFQDYMRSIPDDRWDKFKKFAKYSN